MGDLLDKMALFIYLFAGFHLCSIAALHPTFKIRNQLKSFKNVSPLSVDNSAFDTSVENIKENAFDDSHDSAFDQSGPLIITFVTDNVQKLREVLFILFNKLSAI